MAHLTTEKALCVIILSATLFVCVVDEVEARARMPNFHGMISEDASLEAREELEKMPLFARRNHEDPLYCYFCRGEDRCKNDPKLKACDAPYRTCGTLFADDAKTIVLAKDCSYEYGCKLPTKGEMAFFPNAYVKCHCMASFCNWFPRANIPEKGVDLSKHSAAAAAIDPW
ncbi:unnamed protein product [Notodromas monacha]|uniref:Uncharacterized protein n=1 Tax=Notodromas monacha TaxID=399045 RepID=A0A7R9BFM6_9CRUS|nr:unnamed protein product [Notodromas monacha]CAG0913903.1 unnamed protein product [Notodromas monacha]